MLVCPGREAIVTAPPAMHDSAVLPCSHGCRASTGISHHNFRPHLLSIRLSEVNCSPRPGIDPQSLNSSSQPLRLPGDPVPMQGMYGFSKDCLSLIPFRLLQICCFPLSLKCFFSDSDNCPDVKIRPPASVPPPVEGRFSPTNSPVFP